MKKTAVKLYPIFLSVVLPLHNFSKNIDKELVEITKLLDTVVGDHEIIIIDNTLSNQAQEFWKSLTSSEGIPNLQIYVLTKKVDVDSAAWVGLENALGDFVLVYDPDLDSLSVLLKMLEESVSGNDVVFASNQAKVKQTIGYRVANILFNYIYKKFSGIDLINDAPQYRLLSKRVINFIIKHRQPAVSYRHLPATAGFLKSYINYKEPQKQHRIKNIGESIDRGVRLLVSSTRAPMRIVTFLSLFGAAANLVYSFYVVAVALLLDNVAPGWVSISLQMSGMFFLISLVLLVFGEYILNIASLNNEDPGYHISQEFTSALINRASKLNIEKVSPTKKKTEPSING